jgi:DNA-binding transcriptional MerR regulator
MDPFADLLTIGAVARASGKSASSVRYYERIGLIPAPPRAGGQRRYPAAVIRTLAVIEIAQRAGLTLDDIRPLVAPAPAPGDPSAGDQSAGDQAPGHQSAGDQAMGDQAMGERLRQVATAKLPEARALIERAGLVLRWLEAAAGCTCPTLDDCQLFDEPGRLPAAGLA